MTDFIEYIPRRHGQKPDYWTPDTEASVDGHRFIRQDWAWIAGTTYYVPYEAVHGRPRPAPVNETLDADLLCNIDDYPRDDYPRDDYQRGALDERARCAALADSIADTYAGDECGRAIADAIRAALQETGQ